MSYMQRLTVLFFSLFLFSFQTFGADLEHTCSPNMIQHNWGTGMLVRCDTPAEGKIYYFGLNMNVASMLGGGGVNSLDFMYLNLIKEMTETVRQAILHNKKLLIQYVPRSDDKIACLQSNCRLLMGVSMLK